MSGELHVVPRADLIAHEVDEDCPCGPIAQFVEGGVVYLHPSLDGREFHERTSEGKESR